MLVLGSGVVMGALINPPASLRSGDGKRRAFGLGSRPLKEGELVSPRPRPPVQPEVPGLVELPPGKIAAVATYLEMHAPPEPKGGAPELPISLEPLAGDLARYRRLFGDVGLPWLWFSRANMTDGQLQAIIDHPAVEALALVEAGRDIGLLELDFRQSGECELAFFGLVPDVIGRGLGRSLAAEGIRRAFSRPIKRLWLHTCTLDHPSALAFYMSVGFKPYRRALEVADDPRLTGRLPRDAAPSVPII
jgi:ribosomal protein S18 acetylase RimI-like enzyme